jgi:hypothetical protein
MRGYDKLLGQSILDRGETMTTKRDEFMDIFHAYFPAGGHDAEHCEKFADLVMQLFGYSTGSATLARQCISDTGKKIEAVKLYRALTKATLQKAVVMVNSVWESTPHV